MSLVPKRVTVGTTPTRIDAGVPGQSIEFVASADIWFSPSQTMDLAGYTNVRTIFAGVPCSIEEMGNTQQELAVWVAAKTGNATLEITQWGIG